MSVLDYQLPPELIAQKPAEPRDHARLMVIDRSTGQRRHQRFFNILEHLQAGDLLVVNDTSVIPARVRGRRSQTGGKVELLLLEDSGQRAPGKVLWTSLMKCGGKPKAGESLTLGHRPFEAVLKTRLGGGQWLIEFPENLDELLEENGEMPLPPYIAADPEVPHKSRYQTVYAKERGAVAAPTAGLHFTEDLLAKLAAKGVERAHVTLHVGLGTFMPIRESVDDHIMHKERYFISEQTQAALEAAKKDQRRIIACGTTSVRTLEAYAKTGEAEGATDLFIRPPYEFQLVSGLITNFHLPQTTLLLLVGAFLGEQRLKDAYQDAIAEEYRFYSYGDSMFIQ